MRLPFIIIFALLAGCGQPQSPEMLYSWDKKNIPLDCFHNVNEYWSDLYDYAADEINLTVGIKVLNYCQPWRLKVKFPEKIKGMILFKLDDIDSLGITHKWGESELGAVTIIIDRRIGTKLHYPVLIHELGHALGLEHDDDWFSAMNAKVNSTEKFFQPGDIELLKEVYGD